MLFKTIRGRIAFSYMLLIALAMGALAWYILGFVRSIYIDQLAGQLAAEARLIAEVAPPLFLSPGESDADAMADRYAGILNARVTLIDSSGRVIGDSEADVATMLNHLQRPEIVDARRQGLGVEQRYSDTVQYDALYVATPVQLESGDPAYVRLAVPLRAIDEAVGMLRRRILGTAGIMLLVALVLGVVLAEKTARPIRELTAAVRRAAQGDLTVRLVPRSQDEVGVLTGDLSTMTDRLRATIDELSRERSEAAAILEHMADGIVITDSLGRIQLINQAALRILGTTEQAALGRSLPQIAREEEVILTLRACLSDRQEQSELVELSRNDQFVQLIATPISSGEEDVRCLIVLQDLSQIRRLETVRRDFVSNISHELRTPLASLRAIVDTLRAGAIEDPPAAAHFVGRMDVEIEDLTLMVEALLELSRAESGQLPIRLVPVAVSDVLEPAIERLRPQAERGQLTLLAEIPAGLPLILADPEQLHVVITNLIQNAIQFTPAGGQIRINARRTGDAVSISVSDTGIGIPADVLPRVFERFYKADQSRATRGTGLGLAIARHIVQAHGGEISVTSTEGQGSVFTFTVLAAEAPAEDATT